MARFFDPDEMASIESFAAQQRQRAVYAQQATAQQAGQVAAWQRQYPFARPGVIVPAALSGMAPDEPAASELVQAEVKQRENSGFGWHSFGDVIKGGVKNAKKTISGATNVLQGITRGAFMGLDAGGQLIQGMTREIINDGYQFGDAQRAVGQTNLGIAHEYIQQQGGYPGLLTGKTDVDYGSGWFLDQKSPIAQTQVRRARAAAPLTEHGKAQSLGRWSAGKFLDAGSTQYNLVSGLVDAAVVLAGDPTTYVGGSASRAIKANRLYAEPAAGRVARTFGRESGPADVFSVTDRGLERQAAGLVDGDTRKTVLPERVGEWLLSSKGQAVVSKLVETSDPVILRKTFGSKVDVDTLVQLADAQTAEEVYSVLGPKLGVDIREKLVLPGAIKATVRRGLENVRWAQQMPGQHIDLLNPDDAVENLDRVLANGKVSGSRRDAAVRDMMRAGTVTGRYKVLTDTLADMTADLIDEHLPAASSALERRDARTRAKKLTALFDDYHSEMRKYFVDQVGDNVALPGAVVDGSVKVLPSPHLIGEYINRALPLPDAREIRRETSRFAPIVNNPFFKGSTTLGDFVSGQIFKRVVLLRPAYTVRVVGEEQIRLAASGLNGAFAHPLSHLAIAVSGESTSRTAKLLDKLPGQRTGRLERDLTGERLADSEYGIEALNKGLRDYIDPSVVRTGNWTTFGRQDAPFAEAWADELAELYSDPIAKRLAHGGLYNGDSVNGMARPGIDGIKDWFFDGAGRGFRKNLAEGPDREWLLTRQGADAYIDSVLERVTVKTGGDPDLMRVVAEGRFGDEAVFEPVAVGKGGKRKHQKSTRALMGDLARRAEDGIGPERVKGQQLVTGNLEAAQQVFARYDRATDHMFSYLMTRPTNLLSRSPAFRQFYYQRADELIGFMTKDAQQAAIRAAKDAGVDKDMLRSMRQRAARGAGDLDLEQADILAKGYGLDETKKLLYDMHERSQFFDITRLLFPFGEAWKEVMTTWARIGRDNPVIIRRAGLGVEGARDADLDGDGRGFFYEDEMTGEEMFSIPLVGDIAEVFAGLPDGSVKFEATAKGANVFSQSVYPGFGPMVQMPASKLLPDDPDFDDARKLIIPFGATDTSGGYLESFLPAWAKKIFTGVAPQGEAQERALVNATTEAARVLASTGDYGNTLEEQERLLGDARKAAARLFIVRGLAQSTAPSAPMWEFAVKTKDNDFITTFALAEEYRKLQEEDYRTATARFVAKFGEGAFLSTIGKSTGPSVSTEAYDFSRENPEAARAFKDVYGYFVGKATDELDLTAFQRQFDTGEREVRTPEEARQMADQRLGNMIYMAAKSKVGDKPTSAQRDWLRTIKDAIGAEYPGYISAPPDLAKTPKLIKQALSAADNDVIGRTEAGQAVQVYAKAREKAIAAARDLGLESFDRSPKTRHIREWLRNVATAIESEYPDFANVYDNVLSRELPDEQEAA